MLVQVSSGCATQVLSVRDLEVQKLRNDVDRMRELLADHDKVRTASNVT